MRDTHFTRQERHVINWLKFCTLAFTLCLLFIIFIPEFLLQYVNGLGLAFFGFVSPPLMEVTLGIWWTAAVGSTTVLTYAAFKAQSDWLRHRELTPVIILTKWVSLFCLVYLLLTQPLQFYFLVGAVIDGSIACITWVYYAKAIQSRSSY